VTEAITRVGLDAHKATIQVAMLLPGDAAPVEWQVANEPAAVKRLARKVQRAAPGAVQSCDEAGVCGYTLQRQLEAAQMPCMVIAPALVPRKAGERVKTEAAHRQVPRRWQGPLSSPEDPRGSDEARDAHGLDHCSRIL
jgi:transposase